MAIRDFIDRCFKNKDGRIILFQTPNLPIIIWFSCVVINKIIPETLTAHKVFEAIGLGALLTWALLEIFYGANYFRRMLGVAVLFMAIYSRV